MQTLTYQDIVKDLKREKLFRTPKTLAGYTDKVEALLQEGKFSEAEDFTLDFFFERKMNSKKAKPYLPSIILHTSFRMPDILSQLDAALDPDSLPVE